MVTKYSWLRLVFIFFSGIVLLFVLAPLLRLILAPGLSGLIEAASDQQVSQSIFRTLGIAMSTTVIA